MKSPDQVFYELGSTLARREGQNRVRELASGMKARKLAAKFEKLVQVTLRPTFVRVERYHPERFERVNLIGSSKKIQQGYVVLNKLEAVGQQLRTFLLDKFKIEDVL